MVVGLLGAGLGLGVGACDRTPPTSRPPAATAGPCDDFELDVERIWDTSRRREVSEGLREFAGETQTTHVERIVTKMDAITSDWVMMSERACKDTLVRKTMPEEVYVRVSLCLNAALVQQRTLVTQLDAVDRSSYEHLDGALGDIAEAMASCQNDAVLAYYQAPEDTADAAAAQTADDKTAEAKVLLALGRSDAASGLLADAEVAAKQSGDPRRELDAAVVACEHALLEGDYADAIAHATPALGQAQRLGYVVGEADALICLGTAKLRQGDYPEARRRLEASLKQRDGVFGAEHPRVADAHNRLGNLEAALADYAAAQRHYQRALAIWEASFGPEDPITSRAYHNLGFVHVGLDDLAGATTWYRKALAAETAALGPEHPATALTEANLATVLIRQGQLDEAAGLLTHASEVQARTLPERHPERAVTLHGQGELAAARGEHAEALKRFGAALELRVTALGERHLDTAKTEDALASTHLRLLDYAQATTYAERALATREALLGPANLLTATSYFNLGLICEKRKRYADALGYYERSLVVDEQLRGAAHALTKQTRAAVERLRDLVR